MERTGSNAHQPDDSREPADDQAGEENPLKEIEQHGEALLNFGDIPVVGTVEDALRTTKKPKTAGDLVCSVSTLLGL
jgi:hypothetical protein